MAAAAAGTLAPALRSHARGHSTRLTPGDARFRRRKGFLEEFTRVAACLAGGFTNLLGVHSEQERERTVPWDDKLETGHSPNTGETRTTRIHAA